MIGKAGGRTSKYELIFLALPRVMFAPEAVHWQITTDLRRQGLSVTDGSFFHTLMPELLTRTSYIAVIHSKLLDLDDTANCDRATLVKLAKLLPQSFFVVWDQKGLWKISSAVLPGNLQVWNQRGADELTQSVLKLGSWNINGKHH